MKTPLILSLLKCFFILLATFAVSFVSNLSAQNDGLNIHIEISGDTQKPLLPTTVKILEQDSKYQENSTYFGQMEGGHPYKGIQNATIGINEATLELQAKPTTVQNDLRLQISGVPSFFDGIGIYTLPLSRGASPIEIHLPTIQIQNDISDVKSIHILIFRRNTAANFSTVNPNRYARYQEGKSKFLPLFYKRNKDRNFIRENSRRPTELSGDQVAELDKKNQWLPKEDGVLEGYLLYSRIIFSGKQTPEGNFNEKELNPNQRAYRYSIDQIRNRLPLLEGEYWIEREIHVSDEELKRDFAILSLSDSDALSADALNWQVLGN